jgi:hypothetical protein
MLKFID